MTNTLVPKLIVDVNGHQKTVHVKPEGYAAEGNRVAAIGYPVLSTPSGDDDLGSPIDRDVEYSEAMMRQPEDFGTAVVRSFSNVWRIGGDEYNEESSGAYCQYCGEFMHIEQANSAVTDWVACIECDSYVSLSDDSAVVGVLAEDARMFDESGDSVKERFWYHSTSQIDWLDNVSKLGFDGKVPMVHVGSADAASYRVKHREDRGDFDRGYLDENETPRMSYVYKIRVRPDAVVAPKVLTDMDWRMPNRSNAEGEDAASGSFRLDGVTRYINEHEAIGSMSLIVNPKCLEVVSVGKMEFDDEFQEWYTTPFL